MRQKVQDFLKNNLINALFWLGFTLSGMFIPGLLYIITLRIYGKFETWNIFFINGELAIYSISLFIYTLFITTKDLRVTDFRWRQFFILISTIGVLISVCIYSGLILYKIPGLIDINIQIDNYFLMFITFYLLASAIIISTIANAIESRPKITIRKIDEIKDNDYLKLKKELENELGK